jgi:hypothetical protein
VYVSSMATSPKTTPPEPSTPSAPRRPRVVGRSAIQAYLEAIAVPLPRGRQVDIESLKSKLEATTAPVERLRLIQRIYDAEHRVSATERQKLEEAFIAVAAEWGDANKITWDSWRELGVAPDVLRRAKIQR